MGRVDAAIHSHVEGKTQSRDTGGDLAPTASPQERELERGRIGPQRLTYMLFSQQLGILTFKLEKNVMILNI